MALIRGDWEGVMDAMGGIWDSVIMPIVQPFIDLFQVGMAIAKGDWDEVMNGMKKVWDGTIGIVVNPLIDALLAGLSAVGDAWSAVFVFKNVWTSYIVNPVMALFGPLIDSIKFILDNWDLVMLGMKMAYQRYLKPVFDAISFLALKWLLSHLKLLGMQFLMHLLGLMITSYPLFSL